MLKCWIIVAKIGTEKIEYRLSIPYQTRQIARNKLKITKEICKGAKDFRIVQFREYKTK